MQYDVVDVFSATPLMGNPVAVVFPDRLMSDAEVLNVTSWFNLSETTFVDQFNVETMTYSVRIFTLGQELPFAGHPTLGTAAAVRSRLVPNVSNLIQDCKAGRIPLRFTPAGSVHLVSPEVALEDILQTDIEALASAMGVSSSIKAALRVDAGPVWLTLITDDAKAVSAARPNLLEIEKLSTKYGATGVQIASAGKRSEPWRVRTFAPSVGVSEDPICGSGNVAVAAVRRAAGIDHTDYAATQGQEVGRDGHINIRYLEDGAIEVGGATHITASGNLLF